MMELHYFAPAVSAASSYAARAGVTRRQVVTVTQAEFSLLADLDLAPMPHQVGGMGDTARVLFTDLEGPEPRGSGIDAVLLCSFGEPVDVSMAGFGVWGRIHDIGSHDKGNFPLGRPTPTPVTPVEYSGLLAGRLTNATMRGTTKHELAALALLQRDHSPLTTRVVADTVNRFPQLVPVLDDMVAEGANETTSAEQPFLAVNGQLVPHTAQTAHGLAKAMAAELRFSRLSAAVGSHGSIDGQYHTPSPRLDLTRWEGLVRWQHDVETSPAYRNAPLSVQSIPQNKPIRRNVMNVVLLLDLHSVTGLSSMASMFAALQRRPPWHVGVLFVTGVSRKQRAADGPEPLYSAAGVPPMRGESLLHTLTDDDHEARGEAFTPVTQASSMNPLGEMVARYFLAIEDVADTQTAFTWATILFNEASRERTDVTETVISDAVSDLVVRVNRVGVTADVLAIRAHSPAITQELERMEEAVAEMGLLGRASTGPVGILNGRVLMASTRELDREIGEAVNAEFYMLSRLITNGQLTDDMVNGPCTGSLCFLAAVQNLRQVRPSVVRRHHPVLAMFDPPTMGDYTRRLALTHLAMPDPATGPPVQIQVTAPFSSTEPATQAAAARLALAAVRGLVDAQPLTAVADVGMVFINTAPPTRVPRMFERLLATGTAAMADLGPSRYLQLLAWTAMLGPDDIDANHLALVINKELPYLASAVHALPVPEPQLLRHHDGVAMRLSVGGVEVDLHNDGGSVAAQDVAGLIRGYVDTLLVPVLEKIPAAGRDSGRLEEFAFYSYKRYFRRSTRHMPTAHPIKTVAGDSMLRVTGIIDPFTDEGRRMVNVLDWLGAVAHLDVRLSVTAGRRTGLTDLYAWGERPTLPVLAADDQELHLDVPGGWVTEVHTNDGIDVDNVGLGDVPAGRVTYHLHGLAVQGALVGHDRRPVPAVGVRLEQLGADGAEAETHTTGAGYYQLHGPPGVYSVALADEGRATEFAFDLGPILAVKSLSDADVHTHPVTRTSTGVPQAHTAHAAHPTSSSTVHVFVAATGFRDERLARVMMKSVADTLTPGRPLKFWVLGNYASPQHREMLQRMATATGWDYELVHYHWPADLSLKRDRRWQVAGAKVLALDLLLPMSVDRVIVLDSDQVTNTDLSELFDMTMGGNAIAMPRMCPKPGAFWTSGVYRQRLRGKPFHSAALMVLDLNEFRDAGHGDVLRHVYRALSADGRLTTLDRDLVNFVQHDVPTLTLPEEWLWCSVFCPADTRGVAKVIDVCGDDAMKLADAREFVPGWDQMDTAIARLGDGK